MATKNYTTKTGALKATIADINRLEAKKLKVGGKDVATSVKHPDDTRGVITENDLWGSWAEITNDGEIIFHNDEVTIPSIGSEEWVSNITKVENGKAYVNDTFYCNIETEKIKNAIRTFTDSEKLTSWKSDLTSLENNRIMFGNCINLTSFEGDLSSLTSGISMFNGCSSLASFNSDLSSLTTGNSMFESCSGLTTFTSDLSSLTTGMGMFVGCSSLTTFTSDLSSLTEGSAMFNSCSSLTSFNSDLSSLTGGGGMFYDCSQLATFTSDLSSLTHGGQMFKGCSNLETFTSDLSSLISGSSMFEGCEKLVTFTSDLSSLRDGGAQNKLGMFGGCSKLTNFISDLSSLQYGRYMFAGCSLNTESLIHIAETIQDVHHLTDNTHYEGHVVYKKIHIGIANETPTDEENELLTEIHNKGWEVFVNGSETAFSPIDGTSLIPIDGEQTTAPKPYWAKPEETDEEHAEYIGEDGKFYNILGGQFIYVDDPETYGMFTSLEDAAANMRLTKIEKTNNI